jgi:hypothetical protein
MFEGKFLSLPCATCESSLRSTLLPRSTGLVYFTCSLRLNTNEEAGKERASQYWSANFAICVDEFGILPKRNKVSS